MVKTMDEKKATEQKLINVFKDLLNSMKPNTPNKAKPFPRGVPWINTQRPLTLDMLKGHVVILDFWTYCCINCIHVLEDLKKLEKKYENDPVVIIGVHSAKFKNERDVDNIKSAVARYEIDHPVIVDNDMVLWKQYGINAWPSFIAIDPEGNVIGKIAGEGKREYLDSLIHKTLKKAEKNKTLTDKSLKFQRDLSLQAYLQFPGKIDIDSKSKRLFISDSNHNRIVSLRLKKDDLAEVIHIYGTGESGAQDGNFDSATFNQPQGIAYSQEKLYIADTENHLIREIDLQTSRIRTIAGIGTQGFTREYRGDPLKVALSSPWDLAIDDTYLYIAMAGTHQIWRLNLKLNILENYAGSGRENIVDGPLRQAELAQPSGLAIDPINKRLYFADSEVSGLRFVDMEREQVITLIGKGLFKFGMVSGPFKEALLQHPLGVDVHESKIYVADTYNHSIRVADLEKEEIHNLIYRPRKGVCKIGDKNCDVLPLYEPNDVLYYVGKLYIADTNNHLLRVFDLRTQDFKEVTLLT